MFKFLLPALIAVASLSSGIVSAQSSMQNMKMGDDKPGKVVFEKNGIKLTTVEGSPDFPDAKLTLESPLNHSLYQPGKVTFNFNVENYDLGKMTMDHGDCANSAKGQHIHLILNDEPYIAMYTPTTTLDLKSGGYVVLAFLSRSYHESVKHKGAYSLSYFTVGTDTLKNTVDMKEPLLFYSRPKGDYKGPKETNKILLDYFLVNCQLSKKGYTVKATIDGTEFTFTKWEPYFIEGLGLGTHTITLELQDKYGNTVENKFNPVERRINLMPADTEMK